MAAGTSAAFAEAGGGLLITRESVSRTDVALAPREKRTQQHPLLTRRRGRQGDGVAEWPLGLSGDGADPLVPECEEKAAVPDQGPASRARRMPRCRGSPCACLITHVLACVPRWTRACCPWQQYQTAPRPGTRKLETGHLPARHCGSARLRRLLFLLLSLTRSRRCDVASLSRLGAGLAVGSGSWVLLRVSHRPVGWGPFLMWGLPRSVRSRWEQKASEGFA